MRREGKGTEDRLGEEEEEIGKRRLRVRRGREGKERKRKEERNIGMGDRSEEDCL